nr:hypothetical protein Iba_chr02aCG2540 [Ipomoea batatas]
MAAKEATHLRKEVPKPRPPSLAACLKRLLAAFLRSRRSALMSSSPETSSVFIANGLDIVWQMGFCNYDDEDVDGVDNWPFCGPACYQTTWKFFTGLHFRRSLLVFPSMSNQQ